MLTETVSPPLCDPAGLRRFGVDPGGVDPRRSGQPSGLGDVRVCVLLRGDDTLVLPLPLRSQWQQHLARPGETRQ